MKKMLAALFFVLSCAMGTQIALAGPLTVGKEDTIASVIAGNKGKRITLKLKSGQELTGTVRSVGNNLVHLGALSGKEFFDAAVDLGKIEAVVVRVKER